MEFFIKKNYDIYKNIVNTQSDVDPRPLMEVKEVEEVVRILKAEGSQINHDLTYRDEMNTS